MMISREDIDYMLQFRISDYPKPNLVRYPPAFSMFAFHLFRMSYDDDFDGLLDDKRNDTKYGKFIAVQKKVAALDFYVLFLSKRVASKIYEFQLDAEELFNCYTPVQNLDRHLAGVYYDAPKSLWFVFVKRFYLRIERNLLDEEFSLKLDDYSSGRELEELRGRFIELIRLKRQFKLVKSVGSQGYFSALQELTYSTLNVDEDGELTISPMPKNSKIDLSFCSQTTLVIENHLYCWKDEQYSHLYRMNEPGKDW